MFSFINRDLPKVLGIRFVRGLHSNGIHPLRMSSTEGVRLEPAHKISSTADLSISAVSETAESRIDKSKRLLQKYKVDGYVPATYDASFKTIFEDDRSLASDFLKQFFPNASEFEVIGKVSVTDPDQIDFVKGDSLKLRNVGFDLLCKAVIDSKEHRFIVEMQKSSQSHYLFHRTLGYIGHDIARQWFQIEKPVASKEDKATYAVEVENILRKSTSYLQNISADELLSIRKTDSEYSLLPVVSIWLLDHTLMKDSAPITLFQLQNVPLNGRFSPALVSSVQSKCDLSIKDAENIYANLVSIYIVELDKLPPYSGNNSDRLWKWLSFFPTSKFFDNERKRSLFLMDSSGHEDESFVKAIGKLKITPQLEEAIESEILNEYVNPFTQLEQELESERAGRERAEAGNELLEYKSQALTTLGEAGANVFARIDGVSINSEVRSVCSKEEVDEILKRELSKLR